MNEVNWQDFKVRCSSIVKVMANSSENPVLTVIQSGKLSTYRSVLNAGGVLTRKQLEEMAELEVKEGNGKKLVLSKTCIQYLMEEYSWLTEGMISVGKESLETLATRKGNIVEAESMLLLTRVDGVFYKTHKKRIFNDFLSGEIDYYAGPEVMKATCIVDNKAKFDHPIFLKCFHTSLENGHKEQVQGYMDITGATEGFIAYTLVDCPDEIIEEMRWRLTRVVHAATPESPEVLDEWPKWERSMKFAHIPAHKRVHKVPVEPMTKGEQQKLYDRVKMCREWLEIFHEGYQKKNL